MNGGRRVCGHGADANYKFSVGGPGGRRPTGRMVLPFPQPVNCFEGSFLASSILMFSAGTSELDTEVHSLLLETEGELETNELSAARQQGQTNRGRKKKKVGGEETSL